MNSCGRTSPLLRQSILCPVGGVNTIGETNISCLRKSIVAEITVKSNDAGRLEGIAAGFYPETKD